MKYNTSDRLQRMQFECRAAALAAKGTVVELTEIVNRSLSQNAYLHVLIGIVAMTFGTSLEYAKSVYFKGVANKSIFTRSGTDKRTNQQYTRIRSSAELTKEEMSEAIDRFKKWAATEGVYLPNSQDRELLKLAEVEINRYQRQYDI